MITECDGLTDLLIVLATIFAAVPVLVGVPFLIVYFVDKRRREAYNEYIKTQRNRFDDVHRGLR